MSWPNKVYSRSLVPIYTKYNDTNMLFRYSGVQRAGKYLDSTINANNSAALLRTNGSEAGGVSLVSDTSYVNSPITGTILSAIAADHSMAAFIRVSVPVSASRTVFGKGVVGAWSYYPAGGISVRSDSTIVLTWYDGGADYNYLVFTPPSFSMPYHVLYVLNHTNDTGYIYVNGFLVNDVRAIADLAHENGALLYVDIIQGVGAVPVDVKAMGIDMAACSTFKWLMGSKGFGFMYVRKDLQDTRVLPTQHHGGMNFNYGEWTDTPDASLGEFVFTPTTGPAMYEVSYPSYEGVSCAITSMKYIHTLGVENIRNHVRTLTSRLAIELPKIGFPMITPEGNESPIIVFKAKDPDAVMKKLRAEKINVAMRFGNKLRLSPSIYNNQADIDRLLDVLS
jgi:hypothetical protein